MTSFRKLKTGEDITEIVKGIYSTDKTGFNLLFQNKNNALEGINKLINSKYVNEYHRKFITVIYDENPNQIEGFIISYSVNDISLKSSFEALKDTKLTSRSSILFNKVFNTIFASKIRKHDYYIGNLYVYQEFRNKRHGSKLVEKAKQKAKQEKLSNVLLDVEYDKKYLLNFYEKLGFNLDSKNYHKVLGKTYGCYGLKYEIK